MPSSIYTRTRSSLAAATACFALLAAGSLASCGDEDSEDSSEAARSAAPTTDEAGDTAIGDPTGLTYDATGDPRDATIEIALRDITLVPQFITALPGQTLRWTNEDDVPHQIQAYNNRDFSSKRLAKGDSFTWTFPRKPGRGAYYRCSIHPVEMDGKADIADP